MNESHSDAAMSNLIFSSAIAERNFIHFKIPQFSRPLEKKLSKSKTLTSEDKHKITLELMAAVQEFTFYPTVAQLKFVIKKFLSSYPYLTKGLNENITQIYWMRELHECFVKSGIKMARTTKPNKICKVQKDQYVQTDPCRPMYEDMSAVIETMKQECLNPIPNKGVIKNLMRITFQTRRNFIVREEPRIPTVKERYPALFEADEVRNDFYRISGKCTKDVFSKNLEEYSSIVLQLPGTNKAIKSVINSARQLRKKEFDNRIIPLLLLPSSLDENIKSFLCVDRNFDRTQYTPWIDCNATLEEVAKGLGVYKVYVENVLVCQPKDLVTAMECFVACFFTFNIEYTEECFKTLQVLQAFFMEVEEGEESAESLREEVIDLVDILKRNIKIGNKRIIKPSSSRVKNLFR